MECPTRKPAAELVVWKKQGDGQTTDSDKPEKFVCKVNTVLLAVHSQAFTGEHLLWPLCSTELWILPGYFWQAPVTYPDWLSVFGMKRCCYFFWQVVLRIKPCSNLMSYFKFDFFFDFLIPRTVFFFFPKHFFTRLRSPVDYDFCSCTQKFSQQASPTQTCTSHFPIVSLQIFQQLYYNVVTEMYTFWYWLLQGQIRSVLSAYFLHPVLLSQQLLQLSKQLHFNQQHAVTSVYTRVLQQSLQSFQGTSVGRKKASGHSFTLTVFCSRLLW